MTPYIEIFTGQDSHCVVIWAKDADSGQPYDFTCRKSAAAFAWGYAAATGLEIKRTHVPALEAVS